MQIGILQTGHAPDAVQAREGDYATLFETLLDGQGLTFLTWSVVDGDFPVGVDAADGWLITGSRHGAYEAHDWIPPLEDFIREAHQRRMPLVGICFGHQIVAQALGGTVEKFGGGWIAGPQVYDFDGEDIRLNAWHQDQVIRPPDDARTIASGPGCEHAALVYGDHMFTVQPHPEFADDVLDTLIRTRGPGVVPDALLKEAQAGLGQGNDNARIARRIADFLKEAAHG